MPAEQVIGCGFAQQLRAQCSVVWKISQSKIDLQESMGRGASETVGAAAKVLAADMDAQRRYYPCRVKRTGDVGQHPDGYDPPIALVRCSCRFGRKV